LLTDPSTRLGTSPTLALSFTLEMNLFLKERGLNSFSLRGRVGSPDQPYLNVKVGRP